MLRRNLSAALVVVACFCGMPASAQKLPDYYPADYNKIVEASKAEKTLLIYSNMGKAQWKPMIEGFNKLYPWLTVETIDLGSSEVMERYFAEKGTGSRTADIMVTAAADAWLEMMDRDEIADYKSPEASSFPDWSKPRPGLYTVATDPLVLVWNKLLIAEGKVPTTFAGLVDFVTKSGSAMKGKVTTYGAYMDSFGFTADYAFAKHHGEQAWKWWEAIGPMTRPERSSGPMIEKITAGEYSIGYFLGARISLILRGDPARGKILGWSYIKDGTPVMMRGLAIPKGSTNVNAAKLLLDFLLSHNGQIAVANGGFVPLRSDLKQDEVPLHTYQSVVDAIGQKNIILVDYDKNMEKDRDTFIARWRKAHNL